MLPENVASQTLSNPSNAEVTFVQSTRAQRFLKPSKPCHVGIHWKALIEYSPQMSINMPGFSLVTHIEASVAGVIMQQLDTPAQSLTLPTCLHIWGCWGCSRRLRVWARCLRSCKWPSCPQSSPWGCVWVCFDERACALSLGQSIGYIP